MTGQNIYGSTTLKKIKDHLPGYLLRVEANSFSNHTVVSNHGYDSLMFKFRYRLTSDSCDLN